MPVIETSVKISPAHPVAYFCAEFGLRADLPIYAGGLGILAGDTLKAAADSNKPMVGVGLLYRGIAAGQHITDDGWQEEIDLPVDPLALGLQPVQVDEHPLFIKVHLTQVDIWVECWQLKIGDSVTLYLLDTDNEQNQLTERTISQELYSGTEEALLKQQLILGIGGVKLLHALGIHPAIYHINEGRPSFLHWQLIRSYMDQNGLGFEEASNEAKQKTVYTNHTLVGAGNPSVSSHLLRTYAQYYAEKMGITVDQLLASGIESDPEQFMVTRFALNTSRKASGVSQLHTQLSTHSWPEYSWINVTNGVHLPTWQDDQMAGAEFMSDDQVWQRHLQLKRQTMEYIQAKTGYGYNPDALVIGWARRIAGYKHLDWVFSDVDRLTTLVRQSDRPVTILISGKAHHFDQQGKALLKQIIEYMQRELSGHALFIPNYNLEIAQHLTRGVDVWLNTPEYGKEACGTSGMKAISNGVLNCTVADGWAAEVDWNGMGWVINHQDAAADLYRLLAENIIPLYYQQAGIVADWIAMMRKSIALAPSFSAQRMINEYFDKLYF